MDCTESVLKVKFYLREITNFQNLYQRGGSGIKLGSVFQNISYFSKIKCDRKYQTLKLYGYFMSKNDCVHVGADPDINRGCERIINNSVTGYVVRGNVVAGEYMPSIGK